MKLKKILCIAALSAAVALSGIPAGSAIPVVQAEEAQFAGLDAILQQMYALYSAGDFVSMYALDVSDATANYVNLISASGADRYILDLDGNTKAMMYIAPDGGWWWYFGQMENNLRQGNGTTVVLDSEYSEVFTGTYVADFPGGNGAYSIHWYDDGNGYDILGSFQGTQLNGTYQVNAVWVAEGAAYASSLPITYANSIVTAVGGWEFEFLDYGDSIYALFFNASGDHAQFYHEGDYYSCMTAVGLTPDCSSGHWWVKSDVSKCFSIVFYGNAAASAYVSTAAPAPVAPTPVVPETPVAPETPAAPQPEVVAPAPTVSVPGTYTVEHGDNLSKIAEKVYGDRTQWKKIYDANSDVIKSDYIIWANQVLVIPS